MESLIGHTLHNRYHVQRLLSRQIGRRTFLATDLETQSPVVVKVLLFGPDFTWDDLKLFEREAETLKALDHPAIPKYLDSFDVSTDLGQGFALVQSYIDAVSLEVAAQAGRRFSEAEIVDIAKQLLTILVYLHEHAPAVIHRDIKPSNVLLSDRFGHRAGNLYLIDFGSVQTVTDKKNGTITIVGSYGYIPLEQFTGQTIPASDLYSLGMTLVYLIAGKHPADLGQVNGRIQFDSTAISKRFARWLEKMTHLQLDKRFESARAALTALESEDGSYCSYPNLKPEKSQIEIFRDRDRIAIKILQPLPSIPSSASLSFIAASFFALMTISASGVLIMTAIIFLVIYAVQKTPFYSVITIERNGKIKKFLKINQIQWDVQSLVGGNVNLLTYSPGYTFDRYINERGRTIRGGEVTISPKLTIFVGRIECVVGHSLLSHAELWWLGQELSDFLDLELQVVYSTPKLPENREHY
ncbi:MULTISPECIES: serine/threonine-protein kinase [Cyanophyceae]|uniref:serine/threonine protein kinase n=1 Tax=Cyanophyceae TaxID=3028117 RepID=UPI0016867FC2|nr:MULTISPECIES: serine/threonine-protein kinase [Cyanophyceae]MBD1916663.1 serine/threonine protein kinase [Phormidium sp. FACHB-77]MBD2030020.1 serine/threonine protein kinase [Phormidium sp. FACHB-322]MBD2053231.1 serine/threonine protein kinase [Leptolyngbya sp. FACHB-60]